MDSKNFSPSDYISFVEQSASADPKRVLVTVKLRPEIHRQIALHCSRRGFHQMRFYRDAFALALRNAIADAADATRNPGAGSALADAGAAGVASRPSPENATVARWRELEAQTHANRAAAPNSYDDIEF